MTIDIFSVIQEDNRDMGLIQLIQDDLRDMGVGLIQDALRDTGLIQDDLRDLETWA